MSVLDQAHLLAGQGKLDEAVALVEGAARSGDAEALLTMGHWRLFGMGGSRDPEAAQDFLKQAGEAGSLEAMRTWAYLIANGTGCAADPARARAVMERIADEDVEARRQLDMLSHMMALEAVRALPVQVLSEDPPVRLARGLVSPEECAYLIAKAEPKLEPSYVVDSMTGRRGPHPVRTSAGANFGPTEEDLVINGINRRLALATGTAVECGEILHVLRYTPGQEYRPHVDLLPGVANQRHWTALVYLNADYSGGETVFDHLDLEVKGQTGDALLFRNVDGKGEGDMRTRHAGMPVTEGAKWLASRWIRQSPCTPWDLAKG